MERTYLIQRLNKPEGFVNPFSFGGGFVNGGLSKEAMKILTPIMSFDYMGSAEFEFGELPRAFRTIEKYSRQGRAITGSLSLPENVFYLCDRDMREHVEGVIRQAYEDESKLRLKEPCHLREALGIGESAEFFKDLAGWIELNKGFMFFINQEMFGKCKDLFGVK